MNTIQVWKNAFLQGAQDGALTESLSVSSADLPAQRERYARALDAFSAQYGDGEISVFSVG